jgi:phage gpG-like protein
MFDLSLNDAASSALATMPERIAAALTAKANVLAAELYAKIQQKLSGDVLNPKSGTLAGSIGVTIADETAGISVCIAASADVKYAAIHEFGGTIPAHEILPDKARALAFLVGGKQTFAARVSMPTVTMRERSYMRSSLAEMADEVKDEMAGAVLKVLE